jgi:tetratricopeptide (TPR) repeat protein
MTRRERLARRAPWAAWKRGGVIALVGWACSGCAHGSSVERAYGGDVIEGRYVPSRAYAAFLRGAIAEAEGRSTEALGAYLDAAHRDPASPEPWTRMAQLRCANDALGGPGAQPGAGPGGEPGDRRESATLGDEDVAHALKLDAGYAPAWAARAACAHARGDAPGERAAAARAAQLDPQADSANILLARAAGTAGAPATAATAGPARAMLVALTVTAHDPVVAWSALASWSEAHGDVALWTRALVELARVAPERRVAIARSAEALAGAGSLAEARAVAAAALEAGESPLPAELRLAPRLALDEAVARRDRLAVRRRATRGRLSLDEAAGRALLGGERGLARELAAVAAAADPGALGARLVLAVAESGDLLGAAAGVRAGDTPASAAAWVGFGTALLHAEGPAEVRAALAVVPHAPLAAAALAAGDDRVAGAAGDDRVVRAAVALAAQGALPGNALPPDGALELAVLLGVAPRASAGPSGAAADSADGALDLRHRYLALAWTAPGSPHLPGLADLLHNVAATDPVVAAAAAIVQLAAGAPIPPDAARALLALNPADPLLAVTAMRLAEKVGDADIARRARAALGALGTPSRTVN